VSCRQRGPGLPRDVRVRLLSAVRHTPRGRWTLCCAVKSCNYLRPWRSLPKRWCSPCPSGRFPRLVHVTDVNPDDAPAPAATVPRDGGSAVRTGRIDTLARPLLQLIGSDYEGRAGGEPLGDRLLAPAHRRVAELHRGGYVVDPDINSESLDEYGFIQQFRVVPGPATLIAARDDRGMGSVGILLIGHKFGLPAERVGKDQSIWDRLETVRSTLEETYFVAAEIFDPEQQD
jgi:hypothetical protein